MSVQAKQVSKSGARGKDLDAVVREHLQIIDDKLLHSDRTWGRNVVSHNLPVTLALPGLDKKDAQRIVYSTILRSLEKRGFETRILLDPDRTTIYIAWMTDLDVEEVSAMNALIRSKRLAREDIEKFIACGAIAAPRSASAARDGLAEAARPMTVGGSDLVMNPRGGVGSLAAAAAAPGNLVRAKGISGAEAELLGRAG